MQAIKRRLHDIFGPRGKWEKTSPGPWGTSGRSDLIGCADFGTPGRFIAIEVKHPSFGENPMRGLTEEQTIYLTEIYNAGGAAFVTNQTPQKKNGTWSLVAWRYIGDFTLPVPGYSDLRGFNFEKVVLVDRTYEPFVD